MAGHWVEEAYMLFPIKSPSAWFGSCLAERRIGKIRLAAYAGAKEPRRFILPLRQDFQSLPEGDLAQFGRSSEYDCGWAKRTACIFVFPVRMLRCGGG